MCLQEEHALEKLRDAVVSGDEEAAKKVAEEIVKSRVDPLEVIEKCLSPAMKLVGERFEKGEYFLTNLMFAAEAMKSATGILTAGLGTESRVQLRTMRSATVVLGTVSGDVHDIGKNIVGLLLEANGFEVYDIGKDVPSTRFVEKAQEVDAQIIALSSLMTTTRPAQKDVIDGLKAMGLSQKYTVMVGGAPTSREWADEIGADGWAETGNEAVAEALKLAKARG